MFVVKNANYTRGVEWKFLLQSEKCFLMQTEVADAGTVLVGDRDWLGADLASKKCSTGCRRQLWMQDEAEGGWRDATESARPRMRVGGE